MEWLIKQLKYFRLNINSFKTIKQIVSYQNTVIDYVTNKEGKHNRIIKSLLHKLEDAGTLDFGVLDKWPNQTVEEAAICISFLPIEQLSNVFEPVESFYDDSLFAAKIAICVKNKNPLAMHHFKKIIERNSEFTPDDCRNKLVLTLKSIIDNLESESPEVSNPLSVGMLYLELEDDISSKLYLTSCLDDKYDNRIQSLGLFYLSMLSEDEAEKTSMLSRSGELGFLESLVYLYHNNIEMLTSLSDEGVALASRFLGDQMFKLNRYEEALDLYGKSGELGMSSSFELQGNLYYTMGNYVSAIISYQRMRQLNDQRSDLMLSQAYDAMGKKKESGTAHRRYLRFTTVNHIPELCFIASLGK